ncbi:MAG TPA: HD domain-containing phosphohydrolase [Candidatus Sulfotelmatobacter sp.]|nr:HD domain-containing phosphohydrolase [Candidatus Sulfotelmatobacter sp.]
MPEAMMVTPTRGRLPAWRRLAWRLGAAFLLLTALGILLSGLLQYRAQDRALRRSLGSLLLNIARTGALLIDGEQHQAVLAAGRSDTPAYGTIRAQLLRIQQANALHDAVYTLVDIREEWARFAVISQGPTPLGEEYHLAPAIRPILRRVMAEGTAAYTDIYGNEHGTWITAFAPVRDAAGRTVAVLDVDYRADVYLAERAAVRRRLYVHSLAGALLALLAGLVFARRITRPVKQLAALARRVVEGDLTGRVYVTARDEIGMLANVLHLMVQRLQVSNRSVVEVLVRALEARSGEAGSLRRLAAGALAVAERLEVSAAQREALELGALLHDIGDIRTPEAVLHKPGPLSPEERRLMQQHPAAGVEILETVPLLTPALDVVGAHHERYGGGGYPHGLRGEEIPLTARIFAVVDALDAMTHDRPYRRARPLGEALEALGSEAGGQFDPRVVEATLSIPHDRWEQFLGGAAGAPAPASLVGA